MPSACRDGQSAVGTRFVVSTSAGSPAYRKERQAVEDAVVIRNPNRRDMLILQLKYRIQLEMRGLKTRGPHTAYAIAKREFGLKGNRRQVLDAVCKLWEEVLKRRLAENEA